MPGTVPDTRDGLLVIMLGAKELCVATEDVEFDLVGDAGLALALEVERVGCGEGAVG